MTRKSAYSGASGARVPPTRARLPIEKLFLQFDSLGDNCEFGIVQRRAGVDPLSLLRFAGFEIPVEDRLERLIGAIEAGFEGLGRPETIDVSISGPDGHQEYLVRETAYGLMYHTFQKPDSITAERVRAREARLLPFLRRKLLEDLAGGQKILVWRATIPTDPAQILRLAAVLQSRGRNALLWVSEAGGLPDLAGTAQVIAPGVLRGFVDRLAPYDDANDISFGSWQQVCECAYRLWKAPEGIWQPPLNSGLIGAHGPIGASAPIVGSPSEADRESAMTAAAPDVERPVRDVAAEADRHEDREMADPATEHDPADLLHLSEKLRVLLDTEWYLSRYPDVAAAGLDPLEHYARFGAIEGRDPNGFFDSAWYCAHYPDVVAAGIPPLAHYLAIGARELRNPHPRFDATFYVNEHPEAAANPLLFHLLTGRERGYSTERPFNLGVYLPARGRSPACPPHVTVDVVIPVYRGLADTQRCLNSVLADRQRPPGRIIVVDDASPEPDLFAWLQSLHAGGQIVLIRNPGNRGFIAAVNRGIATAGRNDVCLLNSDTEVPSGWLMRLAGHAHANRDVASVSPFSNNATICGYPTIIGGPPAFGLPVRELDEVCRTVNAGRSVPVPTTVGFCMYIRRAALDALGAFDEATFGQGYGEECDFCFRAAARGWRHLLACDTYVFHRGAVSFGTAASERMAANQKLVEARWPGYAARIHAHVRSDPAIPARFTVSAALFRRSGLPTILFVSHELGGGVRRHIELLVRRLAGRANVLLLVSTARGTAVSIPAMLGHGDALLPAERLEELAILLESAGVARVHVHHVMGMDFDLRALIRRLNVPFDVTVHDYFTICPQVNLLPWLDGAYCGEPAPHACNACIATRPNHNARDILSWRRQHAWLLLEADRVLCPSEDVRRRIARYGWGARAIVAPHEPVSAEAWQLAPRRLRKGEKLRVALIGVLAPQKGAGTVALVAEAADTDAIEFHLIGEPEQPLLAPAADRIIVTGAYKDDDLPALIERVKPHVVWFPAQWPETYSYAVSAAIAAKLPIVATDIGAFPERLAGRPLTWLVDPTASTQSWLATFAEVRGALSAGKQSAPVMRTPVADFYAGGYLTQTAARRSSGPVDLRRPGHTSVVLVPERYETGGLTPCAYIRLLLPLEYLAEKAGLDIVFASAQEALRYRADAVVTQRFAPGSVDMAAALGRHCRQTGAALLYDLDDDLINVPADHADAAELRPQTAIAERMLREASTVWLSTQALADRLRAIRGDARIVPNGLDERIWADLPPQRLVHQGPVRILFMGTMTHDADLQLVQPALERVAQAFGWRVTIDIMGVSARGDLPSWASRPAPSVVAGQSYPGFVNWLLAQPPWDVGIAPLADTPFNVCKSALKALDYAGLGLAVLASDLPPFRGSLADGDGGMLVANTEQAWVEALSRLIRQPQFRAQLAAGGRAALAATGTLAAQSPLRQAAWAEVIRRRFAAEAPDRRRPVAVRA